MNIWSLNFSVVKCENGFILNVYLFPPDKKLSDKTYICQSLDECAKWVQKITGDAVNGLQKTA